MPQTLNKTWKDHLGSDATQVHKQWLDTLGNLTLTGYNSELSNKPFLEKKALYLNSNLSLNKYFQNLETWNEEQIKERAEDLANKAIALWPY